MRESRLFGCFMERQRHDAPDLNADRWQVVTLTPEDHIASLQIHASKHLVLWNLLHHCGHIAEVHIDKAVTGGLSPPRVQSSVEIVEGISPGSCAQWRCVGDLQGKTKGGPRRHHSGVAPPQDLGNVGRGGQKGLDRAPDSKGSFRRDLIALCDEFIPRQSDQCSILLAVVLVNVHFGKSLNEVVVCEQGEPALGPDLVLKETLKKWVHRLSPGLGKQRNRGVVRSGRSLRRGTTTPHLWRGSTKPSAKPSNRSPGARKVVTASSYLARDTGSALCGHRVGVTANPGYSKEN